MKKKQSFMNPFLLVSLIALLISCEGKRKSIDTSGNITPIAKKEITIYGSENCDHCIEFREKMDSLKLEYIFKDAEANEKYYQELLLKIQQANFKGYVSFPVLDINDKIYVKPEFSEFMQILSK
jgi:glutaredoxin